LNVWETADLDPFSICGGGPQSTGLHTEAFLLHVPLDKQVINRVVASKNKF